MSKYTILVYSKNKKAINSFINFLKNNKKQNFQIFVNRSKITKFSILKSPHINKTAQEQFQYRYFRINLSFFTSQMKKKLLVIKKIKNQLFPDLKILIKGIYCYKKNIIKLLYPIYPNNIISYNQKFVKIDQNFFMKLNSKTLLKKSTFYLKTLDYYGKQK